MDGKTVLKDINLNIPYGKKLGIVGGTGSGKSVLWNRLCVSMTLPAVQ